MSLRNKILLLAYAVLHPAWAMAESKRIVSYISEVQDERRDTRWTLTEWLHTKERMQMMDLWLAMFGNGKKEKFAPELSLSYARLSTRTHWQAEQGELQASGDLPTRTGEEGRLQFWFTNLVSSTTGLRTLSIDLGLEAAFRNRFASPTPELQTFLAEESATRTERLRRGGINFRIFGANVQDSGLLLKVGKYESDSGLGGLTQGSGLYQAAEMQLYLLPALGLEGEYQSFGKATAGDSVSKGIRTTYGAFLELANLRIGYQLSRDTWDYQGDSRRWQTDNQDRLVFLRLYF